MEHTIRLIELRLTDGSWAYDVMVGESRFPCISFEDACRFTEIIGCAIDRYTNETTRLVESQELA